MGTRSAERMKMERVWLQKLNIENMKEILIRLGYDDASNYTEDHMLYLILDELNLRI